MTDNSLRALGRGCPQVKSIVLFCDMSVNINIQLVSVNLSWCEMMTAAGVAALAEGCPLLNTFIAKVNTFLSPLITMDNSSPLYEQGCIHIGDEALYQLVRRCSRLQLVNLHGCRNVQDDGVMELAENSPALRF